MISVNEIEGDLRHWREGDGPREASVPWSIAPVEVSSLLATGSAHTSRGG